MHRTTVVAALIRQNNNILICQRRADQLHAGKWEFPGGKLEAGESPEEGLARELQEELGIQARIGAEVERYEYCYPGGKPLLLIFHAVDEYAGELHNCIFAEIRWVKLTSLRKFKFLEGDAQIVQRLATGQTASA
jgi:8-oxo-dGTP diphosphatase